MLKYLSAEEKPLSRDLWEEAFPEDSRSFDDYYYREKTKDNRILADCENGRVQSMVQMNPYLLQAGGLKWRVDYLVGVATRREKRHQGYMRRILERMMADMREEQMPFCFLMPADEAIYLPFGFTYIYRQPQWVLREDVEITRRALLEPEGNDSRRAVIPWRDAAGKRRYLEWLADWIDRWLGRRYQVYTVRDAAYLLRLMEELSSENGSLDVLYDGDTMIGIQGVWGVEEKEQRLLYCEAPYIQEAAEPKPAIMARIITPDQFVRAVHLKKQASAELTIRLYLEDPLIPENQGAWLWHLDRESSWMEPVENGQGTENTELCLTVAELTSWLFGYEIPEAAKPYEDTVETLKYVFLDEVV